ncbi:MAG: methionine--tRNA ligase [Bacteroidetes bacterium]|nr:methionine--tRNA ligase [Bacteroidota bacterium]
MTKYKRYTVTAALPYANGPVHIGHLAGVYIPADIYVRYLRLKGEDVIYVCGSDEHGVPITLKARQKGVSPQSIVDEYHVMNKDAFEQFGISFDVYSRTTSSIHYETASEFFRKLYEKGVFVEKTTEQYFDTEAGQFLADRYITGTCPYCSDNNAFGDQCEKCGTSLSPKDLVNPKSTISGTDPVLKQTKHWYLPLDRYEDFLKKWILDDHKEWKPNVYGQCKSWIIDQGLQPRAVSRDLDWGVPVPVEDAKGKVLYVWFDAPIGYISNTRELTPEWEKYWKDPETKLVHFIGKDNIVFHCIIFPVMLREEGSYILPDNVPANEFLNLEGDKISTSRNWAVWLHEYLEEFKDQQDVLRYVLCANAPETKDNDFTWKDFQAHNNNELLAILGNFINRALVLTHKYFEGHVPPKMNMDEADRHVLAEIGRIRSDVEQSIENYRFREALKNAMDLARLGNKYLADTEPWKLIKTDKDKVKTILNISLQISAGLTILLEPFLPFTVEKIRDFLNMECKMWNQAGSENLLSDGHLLNRPELLFTKIEDEQIEIQLNKLLATKELKDADMLSIDPVKECVTFEDFQKLDLRTGTIIDAKRIPKTKKLLKLIVETGIDHRTVISGIADFYDPQKIIGKKVCMVVNLKPRLIRGIESQGMVLMAENSDGRLCFVEPEKDFHPGSVIR